MLIQFYSVIQCNTYCYNASFFKVCIVQPHKASFYPQTLRFRYNFRFESCPLAKVHEVDTILQESVMQQQPLMNTQLQKLMFFQSFCTWVHKLRGHYSVNRLRIIPINSVSFRIHNAQKFFLLYPRICDSIYKCVLKFCSWIPWQTAITPL